MDDVRDIVDATLRRIEGQLERRASLSRINAALMMADPALILPLPAAALIAVDASKSFKPSRSMAFRSVAPLGPEGDVLFTFLDHEFMIHPWRVAGSSLMLQSEKGAEAQSFRGVGGGDFACGLRIALRRSEDSTCAPGPVSFFVAGDPALRWGLRNSRVYCGDVRLACNRPAAYPGVRSSVFSRFRAIHHHLDAMSEDLYLVRIPGEWLHRRALEISFFFEEAIPARLVAKEPRVESNVAIVWNSVECRYPGFGDVEQAVTGADTSVHSLDASHLGVGWKPWDITYVGASDDARLCFSWEHYGIGGPRAKNEPAGYYLSYVPMEPTNDSGYPSGSGNLTLSIILTGEACARLNNERKRLAIDYRATMGSRANGVPRGSEFQLIDMSGIPVAEHCAGHLVADSWGGADGLMPYLHAEAPHEYIKALIPSTGWRSVGDVIRIIEQLFGSEIEIVDERDLLRRDGSDMIKPIHLRMRFNHPDRDFWERSVVLRSCQSYLDRYLAGTPAGDILLVDINGDAGMYESED